MKANPQKSILLTALLAAATLFTAASVLADNYTGNGNTSFSGAIGNGVLRLTDDGTNINGTLYPGGSMNDVLVIYIDTGEAGGFTTTTNFTDQGDHTREAIAGYEAVSGRSTVNFMNGFTPKYAIALDPSGQYNTPHTSFGGLYKLTNGGSFGFNGSVNLQPNVSTNSGPFTFSFGVTNMGLTNRVFQNIKFLGTYVSEKGWRSQEALGGGLVGITGYNTFTQTNYASYTFANSATTNYSAIFSVDMTAQVANGSFKPGAGDTVYVAGTFEATPWNFIPLSPTVANTNIYVGTNHDYNTPGTLEVYKFVYHRNGSNDVWELPSNENRPFVTLSGTQILPTVYYNNFAATPSATTNAVTFQIDMTAWIGLGRFHPATDLIEAQGLFQTNQWSAGFILTNNPAAANTNLYSGVYLDHNYPGTWQEYKFVIVTNGVNVYENGNNRIYYTPTNSGALTVAFYNNVSPYATPVTFQVDMTLARLSGTFTNGDTVGAAGTFQTNQWTTGFILTNNPAAANTNLYSGIYTVLDQPNSAEYYKFIINKSGGATLYELPASTSGGDRLFALGSSTNAIILPPVFWADANPTNYTTTNTYITFTLNMTNAVDIFSNAFDPANDLVFINGDFANPPWNSSASLPNFWTDSTIDTDFSTFILQNNPLGSGLYTGTFQVPAGHSLSVYYKFGIYHNSANQANTNVDNEASAGQDHHRFIRAVGSYSFPVDIFGLQHTNSTAASEPVFGNLAISKPVSGQLPIKWLGYPGVYLQTSTNLATTNWININATSGLNSTNWPTGTGNRYFRLIQP